MRVLLGSGGFGTEERRSFLRQEMRTFFGEIENIVFIPYAGYDYNLYLSRMKELGFDAGYNLLGIHNFDCPVAAIKEADAVYVGGGNTFRLIHSLREVTGLFDAIHERVSEGMPYMGVSAGSNVACPTMQTTNDMPIICPKNFRAFGFVPYQINAHYFEDQVYCKEGDEYVEHFGETRQDRIREFHQHQAIPVVGLPEGGVIVHQLEKSILRCGKAFLFEADQTVREVEAGCDLLSELSLSPN